MLSEEYQKPEPCDTRVFKRLDEEIEKIYAKMKLTKRPITLEEAAGLNAQLYYLYRAGIIKE